MTKQTSSKAVALTHDGTDTQQSAKIATTTTVAADDASDDEGGGGGGGGGPEEKKRPRCRSASSLLALGGFLCAKRRKCPPSEIEVRSVKTYSPGQDAGTQPTHDATDTHPAEVGGEGEDV